MKSTMTRALATFAVVAVLAAGCHTAATVTTTPTAVAPPSSAAPSSTKPSPTPSQTYGPNQSAAMKTVTGYFGWLNTARQAPLTTDVAGVRTFVSITTGMAYQATIREMTSLAGEEQHQVGDIKVVGMVPDAESVTSIKVTTCVDNSGAAVVNSAGATVPPGDALNRRQYTMTVIYQSGAWLISDRVGGATPCSGS